MGEVVDPRIEKRWEGVPLNARPGGWQKWDGLQVRRWKEAAQKRYRKKLQWMKKITELASRERKGPVSIRVADGGLPVIVEATYGPLSGRPSFIITVREENPLAEGINEAGMRMSYFDGCKQLPFHAIPHRLSELPAVFTDLTTEHKIIGPRRFLTKLFEVIGYFGGNATVIIKPSNLTFTVDPEQFRRWAEKPEEMLSLLAGQMKSLEDHG